MAQIIKAKCTSCGFETDFLLGGGRRDYLTNCSAPAIDQQAGAFAIANYIDHESNPRYTFYNDTSLQGKGSKDHIETSRIKLNANNNSCPTCKNFSLNFRMIGSAD